MKFVSSVNGTISAIRFYKGSQNTGTHTVSLWTSLGVRLASATSSNETASGWQTVPLSAPVLITADTTYVASYHTSGHYSYDLNYFTAAYRNVPLTAPANAGVYAYGPGNVFPNSAWNASNYWVDIVFKPSGATWVNGACDGANGIAITSAPTTNLCSAGTASTVAGTGPWTWSCIGSNGGTTSSCFAPLSSNTGGLLPSDRDASANWRMAGLLSMGGIPNRTTVCATVRPLGAGRDDTAYIQNAIDGCSEEQVVQLAAGIFTIAEGSYVLLNKPITLRGAGPGQTILSRPTGPTCPPPATSGATMNCPYSGASPTEMIHISLVGRFVTNPISPCALISDAIAGSYQITVSSSCASRFTPDQQVLLDELSGAQWMPDPENPNNKIWASSDYRVVYNMHNPSIGGDDGPNVKCDYTINCDRVTNEIKQIKSVSGNIITFDSPVMISYRVDHSADLWRFQTPFLQMAGVESLTTQYADNGSIEMDFCAYCWLYRVETRYYGGPSLALLASFRPQVEESYVHEAAWPVPGGAGYNIDLKHDTSEALIENSISVLANKAMVARGSGSGSVIAYNYVDKQYIRDQTWWQEIGLNASHLVGPHHILFEGNWAANMDSDATHGNSIYLTFFRNRSTGVRSQFRGIDDNVVQNDSANGCNDGSPARTTGPQAYTYWTSFVGNVLGVPGCTIAANGWQLNNYFGGPNNSHGIFMLGWWNGGINVNDPTVATIYPDRPPGVNGTKSSCMTSGTNCATILNGNYDYFRNQISWASDDIAHTLPNSLYLSGKPAFFNAGRGYQWPWVDAIGRIKAYILPAKARYDAGTPFTQP